MINKSDDKATLLKSCLKKGILAGVSSMTAILSYPLEVVKIRYQVLENKNLTKNLIIRMFKEEGVQSFYKGLNQNLLVGFFGYGTVFFFYEYLYAKLNSLNYFSNKTVTSILSSSFAGVIAVIVASPFNYVKTRQILYKGDKSSNIVKQTKSMIYIIKDIYNEKRSFLGFWKALNPSLITSFYSAIQISLYQILKNKFIDDSQSKEKENLRLTSFFGLISRSVACTVIFPFALIRSRMYNFRTDKMIDSLDKNEVFYKSENKYNRMANDLVLIIKREGLNSLFRGLPFELIKVSINGALFFYTYEYLKNLQKTLN